MEGGTTILFGALRLGGVAGVLGVFGAVRSFRKIGLYATVTFAAGVPSQITILNVVVSVKRSHIQVPQRPIVTRSGCHLNVLREASLLNYSCKPVKVPKDPEIRSRSSVVVAKRRRGTEAKTASEHALRPRKGLALVRAIA